MDGMNSGVVEVVESWKEIQFTSSRLQMYLKIMNSVFNLESRYKCFIIEKINVCLSWYELLSLTWFEKRYVDPSEKLKKKLLKLYFQPV